MSVACVCSCINACIDIYGRSWDRNHFRHVSLGLMRFCCSRMSFTTPLFCGLVRAGTQPEGNMGNTARQGQLKDYRQTLEEWEKTCAAQETWEAKMLYETRPRGGDLILVSISPLHLFFHVFVVHTHKHGDSIPYTLYPYSHQYQCQGIAAVCCEIPLRITWHAGNVGPCFVISKITQNTRDTNGPEIRALILCMLI